jgi:hypothetical protein
MIATDNPNNSVTEAGLDEFSISVTECVSAPACPADLNGDGAIDAADLATLLSSWGSPKNDLDGDGVVAASDLATMLSSWGVCQ